MKQFLATLFITLLSLTAGNAQIKIGDNPQNIDPSSVLELESTSRVLVITRVTTAEMNAIAPSQGAMVYNTDLQCIHQYTGIEWVNLCGSLDLTFTNDPIVNFINDISTITITQTGDNYNFEIADNSIRNEQIVNGGINGVKIQNNSITVDKLADDSVGRGELLDDAVSIAEIGTNGVPDANKILGTNAAGDPEWQETSSLAASIGEDVTSPNGTITGTALGAAIIAMDLEVKTDDITLEVNPDNTTGLQIKDDGVTSAKILNETIESQDIRNLSILAADIRNDNITAIKINPDVAGTGLTQNTTTGALEINPATITGDGDITSTDITITDGTNATFNNVTLTIANNAITSAKIFNETITTADLLDETILSEDIKDGEITGTDILDGTIATTDIADKAITRAKLADPTPNLTANQVIRWSGTAWEYASIATLGVNEVDGIIGNEVTGATAGGSLTVNGNGSTTDPLTLDVIDGGINTTELSNNAVTTDKITDLNITSSKIALDAINNTLLSDDAVRVENILNGTANQVLITNTAGTDVEWGTIAANNITGEDLTAGDGSITINTGVGATLIDANVSVTPDGITNDKIADNAINTENIVNGQIQTDDLANTSVTTGKIALNAINNTLLSDDAVRVENILNGTANQVLITNATGTGVEWTNRSNLRTTGTAEGSIFFAAPTTFEPIEDNAQLFWDDAGNRLNLGGGFVSREQKLNVRGGVRASEYVAAANTAQPSYRFDDDGDTGLKHTGANEVALVAGGEEMIALDFSVGNGNVIVANGSVELEEELIDINGSEGTAGQVLSSTGTGTEWSDRSAVAMGKVNGANTINVKNATVGGGSGKNTVTFNTPRLDNEYIIQLTVQGDNRIYVTSQTTNDFTVEIKRNSDGALVVAEWYFTILDF